MKPFQQPKHSFPIYILQLDKENSTEPEPGYRIVLLEDGPDFGHIDFWEQTVASIVADHYGLPQEEVAALPYSQRRARIYANRIYYGEEPEPALRDQIRQAVNNDKLEFYPDAHERRLLMDVLEFEALLQRYR